MSFRMYFKPANIEINPAPINDTNKYAGALISLAMSAAVNEFTENDTADSAIISAPVDATLLVKPPATIIIASASRAIPPTCSMP